MPRRIEEDRQEYRKIIKGQLHKELKELISNGKLLGRRGKKGRFIVSLPSIDIPNFRYGGRLSGIGRGEGKEGDVIGKDPGDGEGRQAGTDPGDHTLVAVDLNEVLDLLQEQLELPNIEPKKNDKLTVDQYRYIHIRKTGPDSLRHIRRTMKQAMLRTLASGEYDEDDPLIIPTPEDMRYKSFKIVKKPLSNAVIFFIRDYSGSIGPEQREIISDCCWWIDHWIARFYERMERVYIGHDTQAVTLDREKFYGYTSGGGTKISSAFKLMKEKMDLIYDPSMWNVYVFYFSDLENWGDDDGTVVTLMRDSLDAVNLYGLVGVMSYMSEDESLLSEAQRDHVLKQSGKVRTYFLRQPDEKMNVIKELLGKERSRRISDLGE